jgi:hypothetical protein
MFSRDPATRFTDVFRKMVYSSATEEVPQVLTFPNPACAP